MTDYYAPDFIYVDDELKSGLVVGVSEGKISYLGPDVEETAKKMQGVALLPAFVNCHSHAFQIGLRGKVDAEPADSGANSFWTWRDKMYQLVESLDETEFYNLCLRAFSEMRSRGIATVAEFNYFHHSKEKRYIFDRLLIRAAQAAGIRLVLLFTFYAQGGIHGEALNPGQQKFDTGNDVAKFLEELESIRLDFPETFIGVAAHSVSAVDLGEIKDLHEYATFFLNLPFHIHVEEQKKEVEDFSGKFGISPIEKLIAEIRISPLTTFVHCTQSGEAALAAFAEAGGTVCLCPSTEANLADGVPIKIGKFTSIGSDSNVRIDFLEELRWLEYSQRNATGTRGHVSPADLLRCATASGARSLGLPTGEIKIGNFADFIAVEAKSNLSEIIFSSSASEIIRSTCVAGSWSATAAQPPAAPLPQGDDPADLAQALCAIPSISGDELTVTAALQSFLTSRGWVVELQSVPAERPHANLFAFRPGQRENVKLLFNSHTDTVPPFIPPSVSNGALRGRGVADAKGQVAMQILAAEKIIREKGEDVGVALLFVVSEETDHSGMKEANALNISPNFLVCGEPTEGKVVTMQKGILKVKLVAQGTAAHSGYPHLGRSAVHELLDVLSKLKTHAWPNDADLGNTDMNVGIISGGQAANALAEAAEATVLFRLISDPNEVLAVVEKLAKEAVGVTVVVVSSNAPVDMRYVKDLLPSWMKTVACFNTDIPYLKHDGKSVLFGMGNICDCHCPREFVNLEDLSRGVELNAALAKELLGLN